MKKIFVGLCLVTFLWTTAYAGSDTTPKLQGEVISLKKMGAVGTNSFFRVSVPNGWLVIYQSNIEQTAVGDRAGSISVGTSMVYIPDENHEWLI